MTTPPVDQPQADTTAASQSSPARIWKVGPNNRQQLNDELAVEEPLQIEIDGHPWLTTMRTPGDDQELALGLMLAEGIIQHLDDIVDLSSCPEDVNGNLIRVILAARCRFDAQHQSRASYVNSSCGVCGKTSIEELQTLFSPITDQIKFDVAVISKLTGQLAQHQATFQKTGGLHGAALFNLNGDLQIIREDVGRHNAVDKVIGNALLLNRLPLRQSILLVSGRVAFEIIHKALAAGIPVIAAISAPTSLAVNFAKQNNQTLIGFLRGEQMNIYSGVHRLP